MSYSKIKRFDEQKYLENVYSSVTFLYLCGEIKSNIDKPLFKFAALQEAYDFLESLPQPARQKIFYNIRKVAGGVKDAELFKKLENSEIWEFRTLYQGIAYRLFAFWDKDAETFVIATHGLVKKTQKTPKKEIEKAEAIRHEYFANKH